MFTYTEEKTKLYDEETPRKVQKMEKNFGISRKRKKFRLYLNTVK